MLVNSEVVIQKAIEQYVSSDYILVRLVSLFRLSCCVVAVAAERLVDVGLAEDHEFVAL